MIRKSLENHQQVKRQEGQFGQLEQSEMDKDLSYIEANIGQRHRNHVRTMNNSVDFNALME